MKIYSKRLLSAFLVLIMVVSIVPSGVVKAESVAPASTGNSAGDIITFGSYPQTEVTNTSLISSLNSCSLSADNTVSYGGSKYKKIYFTEYTKWWTSANPGPKSSYQDDNGYYSYTVYWFKFEPIQWRVLSNSSGELFVMTEKIIDSRAYNDIDTSVTWETCTMRFWLNNNFYNTAFSLMEKTQINTSTVINDDNQQYGTEGGNTTHDKLYLLSYAEAINTDYGFSPNNYSDIARQAQGTDFSKSSGIFVGTSSSCLGCTHWRLRSPGVNTYYVDHNTDCVEYRGNIVSHTDVDITYVGVRPVLKLNFNPGIYTSSIHPSNQSGEALLKLRNKDTGSMMENFEVTVNGAAYTTDSNGFLKLPNINIYSTVTIQAEGFYNYTFNPEVVHGGEKTIYLESLKETTKSYISSVHYRNVTNATQWKDACSDEIKIPQNSVENFDIKIYADWRTHDAGRIVLSQDEAHKIENNTGIFNNKQLAGIFEKNKDIYAYCVASDGTVSKALKIKITIKEDDNVAVHIINTEKFSFDGGPKFTVSDSIPIIGGTEISVDMGYFPFSLSIDGDKYKLALGVEKDTFDWSKWITYKNILKGIEKQKDSIKKAQDMKYCRNLFGTNKIKAGKLVGDGDVDFNIMGYIEWTFVNGKAVITESYVGGSASASYQWTQPFMLWAIPCYYEFGVGVEGSLSGEAKRVVPDSELPLEWDILLNIKPSVNLGGGVGIPKALSLGVNGKGEFDFYVNFADKYRKIDLTLAASIKAQVFLLKFIWNSPKKTWPLYSDVYGSNKSNLLLPEVHESTGDYLNDIYDSSNYTGISDRNYTTNTKWLGEKSGGAQSNSIITSGSEIKTLQTSIYNDSRQQLVEFNGQKMLIWVTDNQSRTSENRTMLVYSLYNATTDTWRAPQAIADDSTADFYPNAVTDGTNVFVTWQNSKTVFTPETATMEGYAAAGEISVAKYNSATGTFETAQTVTNNATLDTTPVLACGNGTVKVVWVNNSANDIFGVMGSNTIKTATFSNGTWSNKTTVKAGLTSIHSLDATISNSKLYVAYAYDMDNNSDDITDLEVFQLVMDGSNVITTRLTDNSVPDSAPQYGEIGGVKKLYWYSEGNLNRLDNLDGSAKTTVFASPTGVNDTFTIAQSGSSANYIIWSQMVDEHVEFYSTVFDGTKWSEPVQICQTDNKALYPSAVVDDNGTMFVGFSNVTQTLVTDDGFSYYEDGQTDLCMLKVFQSANISVSDENLNINSSDVVPNGTLVLDLTVKNAGTVAVDSVDVMMDGVYISTVAVNLLPGQSKDIAVTYTLPATITKHTLNITVEPTNADDYDLIDNSVSTVYGLTDLAVSGVKVEDTSLRKIINAAIENQSCMETGNFIIRIHEDSLDGAVVHEETIVNLTPEQVCLITYSVDKATVSYDVDGMKKYYVEVVTTAEEYSTGNNRDVASFSQEGSEGVTAELLEQTVTGNAVAVYGTISNNEYNPNEVYAKIDVLDDEGSVIGCLLKKIVLTGKDTYTLDVSIPFAGSYSKVVVTIILIDTGTGDLYIVIPEGVASIPGNAYADCDDVIYIAIPVSVTAIGEGAFAGCNALTIIGEKGSFAETYAISKGIPFISVGLTLIQPPNKLDYSVGEALNFTGMRLIYCSTNYVVTEVADYQVNGYDSSKLGVQTVSLTYEDETAIFSLTVRLAYPESEHPYSNYMDQTWLYTHPKAVGSLEVKFSSDTQTESGYDYIYIYDAVGLQVGKYSGTELAGRTIVVQGNSFSIKLTSDGSVSRHGFKVESITGVGNSITAVAGSGCIIDRQNNFIYGLSKALTSLGGYLEVSNGVTLQVTPFRGTVFGTGSTVDVKLGSLVVETYTIIIFGDVTGDGNIDSIDAGVLVDYENFRVSWDMVTDIERYVAGDMNGDGNIDGIDAGILVDTENNKVTIDQTTGLAVPY